MSGKKYQKWSKEELIEEVKRLKKRKKYGLVWDSEKVPERLVVECKEKIPILKEVKNKKILLSRTGEWG